MTTTIHQTVTLDRTQAWVLAAVFIACNIALPQLCHLIPYGGVIFKPIYFFTLVAAYAYGWQVGLLTAVASPLLNSALFGMPAAALLPFMLLKGVLLVGAASFAARRFGKATIPILGIVVLAYQAVGCGIEAIFTGLYDAMLDFKLGFPGMAMQIIGGETILSRMAK